MFNNKYEIIEPIDSGAFGYVFKIKKRTNINEIYAAKQIFISNEEDKMAVEKEIHFLYVMNSDFSVKLIEYFLENKFYYLVMEFCDGNLGEEVNKNNGFSVDKIRKVMKQLNQAFYKMHEHRLIHRDLKPTNILIKRKSNSDFDVKLGDYGFMRKLSSYSKAKTFKGTYVTMAPEVILDQPYDEKADLWSIGVILYYMHFNKYPFTGNIIQIQKNIVEGRLPSTFPEDNNLKDLILSLLKTNPEERLSFKDYLNHPFFNEDIVSLNNAMNNLNINEDYKNLNPFEILNIKEFPMEEDGFHQMQFIRNGYYPLKDFQLIKVNKKAFLSYFMVYNKDKFIRNGNIFNIKNKDHFYYLIINDIENFKKCCEENRYILGCKDNAKRTLLHLAVMGDYYEISKYLIEKGINIYEPDSFDHTALDYSTGILRNLLEEYDESKGDIFNINPDYIHKGLIINSKESKVIDMIYHQLLDENLAEKMVDILNDNGELIGKRICRKNRFSRFGNQNWNEAIKKLSKNWVHIYHGTKFVFIGNIMLTGLLLINKPLEGHIPLGIKVNKIKNWANAIFGSPSIFYASEYSEIIYSDNEEWYIIINALAKPNSYTEHVSSINNYNFKNNEPKLLEYRIRSTQEYLSYVDCLYEQNIETVSLLFVKKKALDNMHDYSEQFIFKD